MKYSKMFIFLLLFSSCQTTADPSAPDAEFETIHVNLDNAGSLHMSDYFSEIKYIHLETPDDKPIGRIRKFLIQDDYLGFYDAARNSVWVYTHDGDFVNEVEIPRGRGPGELESIEDIILTKEGEVHALGAFKIVAYDIEGTFVHETDFNFWIYNFTYDSASETYIGYPANSLNRGLNNEHTAKTLLYLNKGGAITNSYFPIPNGREEIGYMATNNFPGFKSHQLFFSHLVDTVYTVGPHGMAPRYRLDYGRHSITEEVFERRKNYASIPDPDGRIQFVKHEITAN
ncbi:MAG TPA: 6-bladed beta-propeller, partial [Balneolaceae bacterium]|nr:6-bladed beta-propeller [Balneolaceae bacterium]